MVLKIDFFLVSEYYSTSTLTVTMEADNGSNVTMTTATTTVITNMTIFKCESYQDPLVVL